MGKIFGANTKISGKVGQLLYRQTRTGTVISELPVKPAIPRRSARQMDRRTQWGNLAAIYKQFDSMLRRGYENLPPQMSVFNAFIQANIDVVKVYITKTIRLNGGAILAPYQIASNILVSGIRLGSLAIDANTTVGQFSQAVIDNNDNFDEGDQLTFFHGIQSIDTVTRTPRATIKGYKVVLNTAEDTKLWDVVDRIGFSVTDNCLATSQQITNGAAVWVHSRETADGALKVSTQLFFVENSALATYQGRTAFTAAANSYGGINSAAVYLQPEVVGLDPVTP